MDGVCLDSQSRPGLYSARLDAIACSFERPHVKTSTSFILHLPRLEGLGYLEAQQTSYAVTYRVTWLFRAGCSWSIIASANVGVFALRIAEISM